MVKFAEHLPALGVETHVLAPTDPRSVHVDPELTAGAAAVHRVPYVGPRSRQPSEELYGLYSVDLFAKRAALFPRRLLAPDESATWALTAIPAAIRLVRRHRIDAILTTSPPASVHLVGATVSAATGVPWVADVRDALLANPHRGTTGRAARLKEHGHRLVAALVAHRAAAVVAASDVIAAELDAAARVTVIRNGCDFEDFDGLGYVPGERFRITHAGTFFGERSPRAFLTALARAPVDAVARFVGEFRAADREWAAGLELGDRLELHPFMARRRALTMMRNSEALLLLMPERGAAARVIPAKLFDYIAAARPIIAAVPAHSAAAALVRETGSGIIVPPDNVDALGDAIVAASRFDPAPLSPEQRYALSRRACLEELVGVLRTATT